MATSLEIANLALTRIGHDVLTSAFSASGNKASRWFEANYAIIFDALLREHQWNFATKRAVLTLDPVRTITGATAANPVVITSASHGFVNGDLVYIVSVQGMTEINARSFTAANVTTDTFELTDENGLTHTAYSSGGLAYGFVATEFAYRYSLPSDLIRLTRVNDDKGQGYRTEGGYLLSNDESVHIEYIADVGETGAAAQFADVLASRLSAEISYYMTDNSSLTEQAWKIYNDKIRMARTMDSREGTPRGMDADAWLGARY